MALKEELKYKVENSESGGSESSSVSLLLEVNKQSSKYLLHRAIVAQDSGFRKGNACTKTRSEVHAGGKKPWKQKGTGQARAGSKNSPLWNGGGVAFGPKPRSYKKKINTKEWRLALQTALYSSKSKIRIISDFSNTITKPNTKETIKKLASFIDLKTKNLLILKEYNPEISLSVRNVHNLNLLYSNTLNVRDILLAKNIVITEDALENIQKVYHA